MTPRWYNKLRLRLLLRRSLRLLAAGLAGVTLSVCAVEKSSVVDATVLKARDVAGQSALENQTTTSWSASERLVLRSLSLSRLQSPKSSWRNPEVGNAVAIRLGERLFNDVRLSDDDQFACATCHQAERAFQDGLPLAAGRKTLKRNTPSLVGVSANNWWYWDGRKDSLWAQALEPLEARLEMRGSRGAVIHLIRTDPLYLSLFTDAFGPLPALRGLDHRAASPLSDRLGRRRWRALPEATRDAVNAAFMRVGMAIAAYETTLQHASSPFDCFVDALLVGAPPACDFDSAAERGLRIFIDGTANCVSCHSGPLLSDRSFRNVGTVDASVDATVGRQAGVQRLRADPFNCQVLRESGFATIQPADCTHLQQADAVEVQSLQVGALRTPSLRNIANTAPYMHDGRFATLPDVIEHYRSPPSAAMNELAPIPSLTPTNEADLIRFLESLSVD